MTDKNPDNQNNPEDPKENSQENSTEDLNTANYSSNEETESNNLENKDNNLSQNLDENLENESLNNETDKETGGSDLKEIMSDIDDKEFNSSFNKKLLTFTLIALILMVGAFTIFKLTQSNDIVEIKGIGNISQETYNKWLNSQVKQSSVKLDSPDYKVCIKDLKAQYYGGNNNQLKEQCKLQLNQAKASTLDYLITSQWILAEAEKQNITVSDEDVEKDFEKRKDESFKNQKAYNDFLKKTGQSKEQLLERTKIELLSSKLQEKVIKEANVQVTEAEVRDYYNKNKEKLNKPASKDAYILATKDQAQAQEAIKQIEQGKSFVDVVKDMKLETYLSSQDETYLYNVTLKDSPIPFNEEIYNAKVGAISKPIKNEDLYYVYKVKNSNKAGVPTYEKAQKEIKTKLKAQKENKIFKKFIDNFNKEYTKLTKCKEGYNFVDACRNYKAIKTKQDSMSPNSNQGTTTVPATKPSTNEQPVTP